nr:hypothetical protein [Tanacetum cinerariifolium]
TAADQAPSAEETEPFETDESGATPPPHPAYRTTARIPILAPVHMSAWTDSEVARLLAISSPPASPLSPWDRRAHAYTRQLMETEARMSREAWISEIKELQIADRRRQTVISELLRLDHRRFTKTSESRTALQGQITALQGQ